VRRHLGHLVDLGVDALWLSPFYPSPMADFGYDVADYCDVDPAFGDLAGFDHLLEDAHRVGLKVIVDLVPNHTSDRHPWFIQSRSGRQNPKRDWYWWRDDRSDAEGGSGPPSSPGRRPNNWLAAFTGIGATEFPPAWTWDEATGQWYLHLFLDAQPDLNWESPEVREAMADVIRFWLGRGADGFRIDVIHALGKPAGLPDFPGDLAAIPACALLDDPSVHPHVAYIRSVVDEFNSPARFAVGETVLATIAQIPAYYGTPLHPELNLAFNFRPLRSRWAAGSFRRRIDEAEEVIFASGGWPTWVLSNHDNPRHRTRYGSESKARAAAVLMLTLRGTPFLYAGEELGLEDASVPEARQVDPGGRDGCRAPIPWDSSPGHGWAGGQTAWLPWPPDAESGRNVADQAADPESTFNLYRAVLAARRASPALQSGRFAWLRADDGALAYLRSDGDDERVIGVNFGEEPASLDLPPGPWSVEVSSRPGPDDGPARGRLWLGPDEAVILRPGP
jgi:alpha-glucosidase